MAEDLGAAHGEVVMAVAADGVAEAEEVAGVVSEEDQAVEAVRVTAGRLRSNSLEKL